jgi:hypothetical protein
VNHEGIKVMKRYKVTLRTGGAERVTAAKFDIEPDGLVFFDDGGKVSHVFAASVWQSVQTIGSPGGQEVAP